MRDVVPSQTPWFFIFSLYVSPFFSKENVPNGGKRTEMEKQMKEAAANLEFEKAAALRDELLELRKQLGGNESVLFQGKAPKVFEQALRDLVGT